MHRVHNYALQFHEDFEKDSKLKSHSWFDKEDSYFQSNQNFIWNCSDVYMTVRSSFIPSLKNIVEESSIYDFINETHIWNQTKISLDYVAMST